MKILWSPKLNSMKTNLSFSKNKEMLMYKILNDSKNSMKSKYLHLFKENPKKTRNYKRCSETKWNSKIKNSLKSNKIIDS